MNIVINGESRTLNKIDTLSDVLDAHADQGQPYAIALNGEFIPRIQHPKVQVKDGDEIEIVSPVGGG